MCITRRPCLVLCSLFGLLFAAVPGFSQQQANRVTSAIDAGRMITLADNVSRKARQQFDQGPVDPSFVLPYVTMVLKPSAQQQAALQKLLAQQQNPKSANYRKWLTPQSYADRFGVSRSDMNTIANWLQSQGFTVVQQANARNWIAFQGTVAQVQAALHTEIHHYNVDGETHFANATSPSVPEALADIVVGFRGLDDFRWKAMGVHPMPPGVIVPSLLFNPNYTFGSEHFLAPDDIATIYDLGPLYSASPKIDGTGIKMAIVGQSDITISDIQQFRTGFNLPTNNPQVILVPGSPDPGHTGDEIEADLDLEWAGAVARNSTILYVNSDPSVGGVINSSQYVIDNNLAPIINFSFGLCEPQLQPGGIAEVEPILQQAESEGISFFASSGDSGAADCDNPGQVNATHGLAVNYPASSPEVTGVGGTEFNEGSGDFWNSSNGTNGDSAKSYIPEIGWNDTGLGFGIAGTGGGVSDCATSNSSGTCIAGFAKPSWQTGAGVPADGVRDVPDISLTASADHDGYILCTLQSCANGIAKAVQNNSIVGGTSASSPVFAGIVALLNQYLVSQGIITQPGLGLINSTLYPLAAGVSAAFHDVTGGNNVVPCAQNSPDCPKTAPLQIGYNAGNCFDLVTGLGSVDAGTLVTSFAAPIPPANTTTQVAASAQVGVNVPVSISASVAPVPCAGGTPAGTVTFFDGTDQIGTGQLSGGAASLSQTYNAVGNHSISAAYDGSATFNPSTSSPVSVNVVDFTLGPQSNALSIARGQPGQVMLTVTPNGITGAITLTCTGAPSESTCTAPSVTSDGTNPVVATVSITTTAPSGMMRAGLLRRSAFPFYALLLPGVLGVVAIAGGKSRRRIRQAALLMIVALVILWMPACGGGSSTPHDPGTPTGSFTLTVTATGAGLSRTAAINLTVTP